MDQQLAQKVDRLTRAVESSKAAAIMAGSRHSSQAILAGADYDDGIEDGGGWLKALSTWKVDPESNAHIKAVLGTSDATGLAIVPNNAVARIAEIAATVNPFRDLMNVVTGIHGPSADIPYEVTGHQAALLQGAYGSNKDIRDFTLGNAVATLYTIAEIVDVGNQLLRQSEGAAERLAFRRLGKAFGLAEANFILNGTGSSQPLGILPAMLAYGDIAAFKTTLSSEPRAATIGRGIGALELRGETPDAVLINPTTFWTLVTEGLGTAYAGGWALEPSAGPSGSAPRMSLWGLPVVRTASLATGQAIVGNFGDCDIFLGGEYRIDVSSEGGNRFDQNITGFRAEEEFGFNAEPYVRTGKFQKVLGL